MFKVQWSQFKCWAMHLIHIQHKLWSEVEQIQQTRSCQQAGLLLAT